LLDDSDPEYPLNVLSLVEAISESPKVILMRQVDKLKTLKMAELKAEGMEYEERIEALDKVEHVKPLRDFTYDTFNAFAAKHPWVGQENISPKSIARELIENLATFNDYILEYALQRSEGVLLRYLSMTYKALVQTVPESFKSEGVYDIIAALRTTLGRVDSSLIQEWEQMLAPAATVVAAIEQPKLAYDPDANPKAFNAKIRADMHAFVKALSRRDYDEAIASMKKSDEWSASSIEQAIAPFYEHHTRIVFDPPARQPHFTTIKKLGEGRYEVRQVLVDEQDDNDWYVEGLVELNSSTIVGEALVSLKSIAY
jgi:hypothetical protein